MLKFVSYCVSTKIRLLKPILATSDKSCFEHYCSHTFNIGYFLLSILHMTLHISLSQVM